MRSSSPESSDLFTSSFPQLSQYKFTMGFTRLCTLAMPKQLLFYAVHTCFALAPRAPKKSSRCLRTNALPSERAYQLKYSDMTKLRFKD
eukprot:3377447-Amphidinium_carterae.1